MAQAYLGTIRLQWPRRMFPSRVRAGLRNTKLYACRRRIPTAMSNSNDDTASDSEVEEEQERDTDAEEELMKKKKVNIQRQWTEVERWNFCDHSEEVSGRQHIALAM